MSDGKNAPGLRGFPTPNSVSGEDGYTVFRFPNDASWGQLILGAVQALAYAYNWYESGDLDPEEAADAFRQIVEQAPLNLCGCELPGGSRVIRINPSTGRLEELNDENEWSEPTGDYAVPPVTPREGGTPEDQMCLAAANAAHVLEVLYESITDSIADGLTAAEAYTALVAAFIAAVGWEFAPIAFALAAFFLAVFEVLYAVVGFLAADVWDSTFTNELACALYGCANNDAGVVTFDWPCVQEKLAEGTDALNIDQLRLFGQLTYLIQVIGGSDGLNQAGATTAVTEYDCSGCAPATWCYQWTTDELAEDGWTFPFDGQGGRSVYIAADFTSVITSIEMEYETDVGSGTNGSQIWLNDDFSGSDAASHIPVPSNPDTLTWAGEESVTGLSMGVNSGDGGTTTITRVKLMGNGARPGGWTHGTDCS